MAFQELCVSLKFSILKFHINANFNNFFTTKAKTA